MAIVLDRDFQKKVNKIPMKIKATESTCLKQEVPEKCESYSLFQILSPQHTVMFCYNCFILPMKNHLLSSVELYLSSLCVLFGARQPGFAF